jgi:7,8-dihydropterin-6-yl-methyl-4-(beta-D-ribofuranosyl)aminobenzene 5'-phosphate synthase
MSSTIRLTCLINDTKGAAQLPVEHGLSFLIETDAGALLFDTGQTGLVVDNARHLGLDLSRVDRIVLSHGHYDHTGGLDAVLQVAPHGTLFLHPAALERKYSRRTGTTRDIGMPKLTAPEIRRRGWNIVETLRPTKVMPGFHVTGPVPRETPFEDVGGSFFLDDGGTQVDPIIDDQAVYFSTRAGIVVILGCAHAGVINTLRYISQLTGGTPFHAVIGGMHLLHAPIGRLTATTETLRQYEASLVAPCHCTGSAATAMLRSQLGPSFRDCGVGSQFVFEGN